MVEPLADCATLPFFSVETSPARQVTIDGASDRGALNSLSGFLNGISVDENNTEQFGPVVASLKPKFWRIGNGISKIYPKISSYETVLTVVVSDVYADSFQDTPPWNNNWVPYESWLAQKVVSLGQQGVPVAYWDVWGEPQGGTPFKGTYAQLVEFFQRTYTVIKAALPGAKVIGPSFDNFSGSFEGMTAGQLIIDLDTQFNIRLDGLSWHELNPAEADQIPYHVELLRDFLSTQLPGYEPELHVNEYSNSADHHWPGHTLGYLYGLHQGGIDVAARACWPQVPETGSQWSDCWAGLNGLLMKDNATPQSVFWLYRHYADLVGNTWLKEDSTDVRLPVIAVRSPDDSRALLIGRYSAIPAGPDAAVTVTVTNLPWERSEVTIVPIVANPPSTPQPAEPEPIRCIANLAGSALQLTVASMADGSAQSWTIRPVP